MAIAVHLLSHLDLHISRDVQTRAHWLPFFASTRAMDQALTPLSHSFYFIRIFPDLCWKIQVEFGTFSATDGLVTPVKVFCLPHTQTKTKIRLSSRIIKIGRGKQDWAYGKAFQMQAAFKSYWTLFLNASVFLHESSLHPKQGQSSRKQAFCRSFPAVPLVLLHMFFYYWTSFLSLPMIFCFVLLYSCTTPSSFLFLYNATAVLVPLVALALVSAYFSSLLLQRVVNFNRHN